MLGNAFILKDRVFYRKTLVLMLPAIIQQLITVGINFMDNLMIGSFGETTIAAASFGNQFYQFFQFVCMGLGSGAVVMSSQFWGRRDNASMRISAAIALRVTFVICAVFTLVSVIWPQVILRIFTNDAAVVEVGAPYMLLLGTTFILAGLTSSATYLLRSAEQVTVPLIGSGLSFLLNILFNWIFIFGKWGAPALGLVGAAVGTVIARVFEFLFIFGYFLFIDKRFNFRLKHFLLSGKTLRAEYIRYSVPVLISDTLLGLSLSMVSVIYGHVGAEMSAANSITASICQLIAVTTTGMAGASAVVVGNTIGAGDIPRAKREGNTYLALGFLLGAVLILPLALLEGPYLNLYAVQDETRELAHMMMLTTYFMLPMQGLAYVVSKGVLRGGGDSRFLLLADSSLVWFFSLPLGALSGLVWGLSPFWTYLFLRLEFPLKGIVCLIRYCSGKWIHTIDGLEPADK